MNQYEKQPVSNLSRRPYTPRQYPVSGNRRDDYGSAFRQPASPDRIIDGCEMPIERKVFKMSLRENDKGQILRIIEEVGGRHNTIIIPVTGLPAFMAGLAQMVKAAEQAAPKKA